MSSLQFENATSTRCYRTFHFVIIPALAPFCGDPKWWKLSLESPLINILTSPEPGGRRRPENTSGMSMTVASILIFSHDLSLKYFIHHYPAVRGMSNIATTLDSISKYPLYTHGPHGFSSRYGFIKTPT